MSQNSAALRPDYAQAANNNEPPQKQPMTILEMREIAMRGWLASQTYDPKAPCPYDFSGP